MFDTITVLVQGNPSTQGSKNIGHRNDGSAFVYESSKGLYKWRKTVAKAMKAVYTGEPVMFPVSVDIVIFSQPPKSDLDRYGDYKPSSPFYPLTGKDGDKIARGIFDSGTGVIWKDDRHICDHSVKRRYVKNPKDVPYVRITIRRMASLPLDFQ